MTDETTTDEAGEASEPGEAPPRMDIAIRARVLADGVNLTEVALQGENHVTLRISPIAGQYLNRAINGLDLSTAMNMLGALAGGGGGGVVREYAPPVGQYEGDPSIGLGRAIAQPLRELEVHVVDHDGAPVRVDGLQNLVEEICYVPGAPERTEEDLAAVLGDRLRDRLMRQIPLAEAREVSEEEREQIAGLTVQFVERHRPPIVFLR